MVDHFMFATGSYVRKDGRLRLGEVDVTPTPSCWYYQIGTTILAADLLREAVKQALAAIGAGHSVYSLSLLHAIVLYPEYITANDLHRVQEVIDGSRSTYHLTAELPFGHERHYSRIIIDPAQASIVTVQ